MAEPSNNSPQVTAARGRIEFEADMLEVNAQLDSLEQRIDGIGEKFARAFGSSDALQKLEDLVDRLEQVLTPAGTFVEAGPPVTGENGVTVTPIQPTSQTDMARIAESTDSIREGVGTIIAILQTQGTP